MPFGEILVVDDQENWQIILKRLLEKNGFVISQATNFQEAKKKLEQRRFDLVILDVRLKDEVSFNVGGLGLIEVIKFHAPNTRIIILTGYYKAVRGEIKNSEVDTVLLKVPDGSTFDKEEFITVVKKLTENRN